MSATGATELEQVVVAIRPSARMLFGPAALCVVGAGALTWLTGSTAESWQRALIVAAGALLFTAGSVLPLLAWLARRTIITTKKTISQQGLFVRIRTETLHSRGYDVTLRRTPAQGMFRCADLLLQVPGGADPIVLHDLPNPVLVQSVLNDFVANSTGAATGFVGRHGGNATDVTQRFDPNLLDDTQAI